MKRPLEWHEQQINQLREQLIEEGEQLRRAEQLHEERCKDLELYAAQVNLARLRGRSALDIEQKRRTYGHCLHALAYLGGIKRRTA